MAGEVGPVFGPCSSYATWDDVDGCGCSVSVDEESQALWLALATEVVWGITGGKFAGACERVFVPCNPGCVRRGSCSCRARASIDLGTVPVWSAEVTIDGEPVEVTIENWRYIVRVDELQWPVCTDDWSVTIVAGWPIPSSLTMATARLACEFAKQCAGLPCGLDPRTTSYTREGITVQIADPAQMVSAGRTGIPFVDMILANPLFRRGGEITDLAAEPATFTTWPVSS